MTAQPISGPDPEDPAEILSLLPRRRPARFVGEYRDARPEDMVPVPGLETWRR